MKRWDPPIILTVFFNFSFFLMAIVILLFGCSKKIVREENVPEIYTEPPPLPVSGRSPLQVPITKKAESDITLLPVYFDFDRSEIREDQRPMLYNDIAYFIKHPKFIVFIDGHCDERGTIDYNLALGMKRAEAVEAFLARSGITNQILTASYGKEMPAVSGKDEVSYSKNRRAEVRGGLE